MSFEPRRTPTDRPSTDRTPPGRIAPWVLLLSVTAAAAVLLAGLWFSTPVGGAALQPPETPAVSEADPQADPADPDGLALDPRTLEGSDPESLEDLLGLAPEILVPEGEAGDPTAASGTFRYPSRPPLDRAPGVPADALSPRNASYDIEVTLDPETRRLTGRQVLTWTNLWNEPTDELWFHLYWNAWRNDRSTWMLGAASRGRLPDLAAEDWGWLQVDEIRLLTEGNAPLDLTDGARYESPDDGNPEDRTVMVVPLPLSVGAGETVRIEMEWRARVPRTVARTGVRGEDYLIAHWFPKLGVYQGPRGWNCHQFHAATEFFSDYGTYDVSITLPERFVVGSTGRQAERRVAGDGLVTHRYVQEDVHAFTWVASPHYREERRRFEEPGLPPVDIRFLYQPNHAHQVDRHFRATMAALRDFGTWYGPYPYAQLTVVDPSWEAGHGGMEYPTLFTCGSRIMNPMGGGSPESVTIHEAGHQFWYGVVGSNEFESAWIDEGLTTFSTARAMEKEYGPEIAVGRYLTAPGTDWRSFLAWGFPSLEGSRLVEGDGLDRYRRARVREVPATPTYLYDPSTAGSITYSKTAVWLHTLERYLGWPVLREILSTFYQRWAFQHPEPEDFFAIVEEVSLERRGESLDWYIDQVFRDARVFDYAIDRVSSRSAEPSGWVERRGELVALEELEEGEEGDRGAEGDEGGETYRTEVIARRLGDGIFPVEVLLMFEDGSQTRRSWDGQERWIRIVHEGPSKLAWAEVDPEDILALDIDRTNNSRLREEASKLAATKWSSSLLIWVQDLLHTFSFFAVGSSPIAAPELP